MIIVLKHPVTQHKLSLTNPSSEELLPLIDEGYEYINWIPETEEDENTLYGHFSVATGYELWGY